MPGELADNLILTDDVNYVATPTASTSYASHVVALRDEFIPVGCQKILLKLL